ncbi:ribbon-helix-helix protein, CopG family [Neosynechococcus sphagnicola]|nr:ribbon-helix-helix protein, CopG family [Neosynechococcus sphagnicola]
MKQVLIRVSEKEAEQLKKYCELTERTQNDVLRELIRRLSVSGALNPID